MKKSLLFIFFAVFVLGAALFAAADLSAQAPEASDPEPSVRQPLPGAVLPTGGTIEAILEPGWTAPVVEATNSLAWGDYDLDGDLDLLLGNSGDNTLYANQGGSLTAAWSFRCESGVPDETHAVAWGDFNRDGYLDIAVGNNGGKSCIYRNQGNGTFQRAWLAQNAQTTTSLAWAGWDVSGEELAFLALGHATEPNAVYRYEAGSLDLWWTDPQDATTYDLAWGDFDGDGDPDLAVANFGQANYIYLNDPAAHSLTAVFTTTETEYSTSVSWGDMDGDGDLDLAVGNGGTTGLMDPDRVYCNQGGGIPPFALCWTSNEVAPTRDVDWGDYDGDGDLDLAAASGPDALTRVYNNVGGMLGGDPAWDADDDGDDSRAVAWSDANNDGDLELAIGYYGAASVVYVNTRGAMRTLNAAPDVKDTRGLAWGDLDGDGWPDLAVGNSGGTANEVLRNVGGTLVPFWTSPETENTRAVAWGDFDGDGDLDLAAANGQTAGLPNRLYLNQAGSLNSSWTFGDGNSYALAWGDFDGDQDLDLAVGNYEPDQPNVIYLSGVSSGTLAFSSTIELDPASDNTLSLAWGDFDQDFDLDLAVGNSLGPNRVYVNEEGSLANYYTLPGSDDSRSLAWGDWNGDGYPDLAVGNAGAEGFVQILQTGEFSDTWTFTEVWRSTETNLDVRSVAWGDYDGDGDLDLAAGVGGQWGGRNAIYRNVRGVIMVRAWSAPAADADPTRSVAWADVDLDGDLDLAAGNYTSPANPNRLYLNTRHGETNLANDPAYALIQKPGVTDDTWFFANYEILGQPEIDINYFLYDNEGDRAFEIEPQVSWDGGGAWEPAWEAGGDGTTDLAAGPGGVPHLFVWDVLNQLLDHQGLSIPVPPDESQEEMDVAFRILVWSNPDHGGLIQRPSFGDYTTLFRADMRPDWYDSIKLVEPKIAHPGETVEFTILVTQTDHGLPPEAFITDFLPPELSLVGFPYWNLGDVEWTTEALTWTGALDFRQQLEVRFDAQVTLPLTNGLVLENCADVYDGLHPMFTRCTTMVISSTPTLTESWKLVNGQQVNTAYPGDPLTYTLVLTNTGTENAWHGVIMTDTLPPHVIWADYLTATGGLATYSDGMVTWQGVINVYEPVTVTYRVTVTKPLPGNTVITNTAWVSDGVNPAFWIAPPAMTFILAPDLRSSAKTGSPAQVELGDLLTYTLVLTNDGALAASPATLVDPIPFDCTYVPGSFWASSGEGGYDPVGLAITWTGEVSIVTPVTLTFVVTSGAPVDLAWPVITNTAYVTDSLGGEVTLVATTTVLLPDLSGSQKWASAALVEMGDVLTYTLVISNSGGYAPLVQMEDPMPVGATYRPGSLWSSDGQATYNAGSNAILWTEPMTGGYEVTVTFAIIVGCPPDIAAPLITNVAYIEDPVDRIVDPWTTTNVRLPELATSEKTASASSLYPGELLTYTVVVRNSGGYAPYVWFSDLLPLGMDWTGAYDVSQGTLQYDAGQRRVNWMGGPLATGAEATIHFQVEIVSSSTGIVTNTVEIGHDCTSLTKAVAVEVLPYHLYLPLLFNY